MNENTIKKAFKIVNEANDSEFDFMGTYSEFLTGTGERSVDFSEYTIPLDDYYYLEIDFVDFGLSAFAVREWKE